MVRSDYLRMDGCNITQLGYGFELSKRWSQGSVKVPGVAHLQSYGYIAHEGTPHPHDAQNVGPPPPCGPPLSPWERCPDAESLREFGLDITRLRE